MRCWDDLDTENTSQKYRKDSSNLEDAVTSPAKLILNDMQQEKKKKILKLHLCNLKGSEN